MLWQREEMNQTYYYKQKSDLTDCEKSVKCGLKG